MFNKAKKIAAAAVTIALVSNIANGAGFALYEFSARGNAMGGAVMANKAEPASIATNPALITQLEGTQLQVGATYITAAATTTINGVSNGVDDNGGFLLPNFYLTHQSKKENIYFGLAGYSRFGLGGEYNTYNNWYSNLTLSPATTVTQAYKVGVESFSIVPEIAVKASDELSLAMGLEVMTLSFQESVYGHVAAVPTNEGKMDISGSGVSWGGNFGVLYKPEWASKWGFGASYKTKMREVLDGRIAGSGMLAARSGDVRGSVTLPDMIMAGISFQPTKKLVLETGIVGTFWSSYDAIRIDYKDLEVAPGVPLSIVDKKNYKDAIRVNIGGEYSVNDNWDVRAGYVYDQSPINTYHMDNLVPVDDRHILNVGLGYHTAVWGVDGSYSYLMGKDKSGYNNAGQQIKYTDGRSNMIGLTFKYKFN